MLEHDSGIVRAVAWSEICPWLSILRTFRIAISLRVLVFGALGILLTLIGWSIFGALFQRPRRGRVVEDNGDKNVLGPSILETVRSPEDWRSLVGLMAPRSIFPRALFLRRGLDFPTQSRGFAYPQAKAVPALACFVLSGLWTIARLGIFRRRDLPYCVGPIGRRAKGLAGLLPCDSPSPNGSPISPPHCFP